jgi:hypothetical protein
MNYPVVLAAVAVMGVCVIWTTPGFAEDEIDLSSKTWKDKARQPHLDTIQRERRPSSTAASPVGSASAARPRSDHR